MSKSDAPRRPAVRFGGQPEQRSRRGPSYPTQPEAGRKGAVTARRTPQAITGFAGGPKLWLKAHSRRATIRRLFVRFM
jgi:hypothetical protein